MKTIEDVLTFYNVEVGKTYKITKIHDAAKYPLQKVGDNFTIVLDKNNCLLMKLGKRNRYCLISNLMYLDYVGVDYILLDETEKRYLSNIIKPFRNRVRGIRKDDYGYRYEYIVILYDEENAIHYIPFPYFEKGKMYKNMVVNNIYTLEQLGL